MLCSCYFQKFKSSISMFISIMLEKESSSKVLFTSQTFCSYWNFQSKSHNNWYIKHYSTCMFISIANKSKNIYFNTFTNTNLFKPSLFLYFSKIIKIWNEITEIYLHLLRKHRINVRLYLTISHSFYWTKNYHSFIHGNFTSIQ
jgi:hypothetical protein